MPVTYLVRMRALEGQEQEVEELLCSNADRIRAGEPGNLAFAVHRSTEDRREFWLYTPLGWPIRGLAAVKEFVGQFHTAYPGLRVALHDEFASSNGERVCFRFVIHFTNSGPFYGNPPTGEQGTMSETHAVRLRDGRIVEQFVGDNNFSMPYQELVVWQMDFPRETPDPSPPLTHSRRGQVLGTVNL